MYIPVGDVCHEVSEPRQVDKGVLVEGWPGTKCKYGLKWASLVQGVRARIGGGHLCGDEGRGGDGCKKRN